jgi:hypothetical protein
MQPGVPVHLFTREIRTGGQKGQKWQKSWILTLQKAVGTPVFGAVSAFLR